MGPDDETVPVQETLADHRAAAAGSLMGLLQSVAPSTPPAAFEGGRDGEDALRFHLVTLQERINDVEQAQRELSRKWAALKEVVAQVQKSLSRDRSRSPRR